MKRPSLALAALGGSLCLSVPAFAQSADDVVVTSTRLPEPLAVTPGGYVVTADQIEARGAVFAADVLATVPGVNIREDGFGGAASLSLRGASGDQTLVLIDGVPVNDPSQPAGEFDFSSLDLASVQRVEVLSGPQGSLWGSDAIGGVVSITSKEPNGLTLGGEGGSLDTFRGVGSFGHAEAGWAAGVVASGFSTAGVPNADEKYGNNQADGFNDVTVALNGRVQVSPSVTLDARLRYVQSDEAYDVFSTPDFVYDTTARADVQSEAGYVRAQVANLLGFDQTLRVDLMSIDRQYYGQYPFGARGDQEVARWLAAHQAKTWGLEVGLEHKRAAENTGTGLESRNDDDAFAIGRWTPDDRFNATVSVREDLNQGYQGVTTARVAASYRLGWGFSVLGSAGQGFKAPSIYEITYPCLECTVPGPPKNLLPEKAVGEDGGVEWQSADGGFQARATLFRLNVTDEIDYIYPIGYLNLASMNSAGAELTGQARLPWGFSVRASYAYIQAADGTLQSALIRVPRDTGSGSLDWRGGRFSAEAGFRGQDQAPDTYGEIRPFLLGYVTAGYDVTAHLRVTGRIEDVANTHYEQAFGYGEPGRMVLVGLSWR